MFGATAFSAAPFASLGSSDVAVALSGVQATGQVSTVGVTAGGSVSFVVSGVFATGQVGTAVGPSSVTVTVTGVSATGRVGQVNIPEIVPVTGVYATGYTYTPQIWVNINTSPDSIWTLIAA